VIHWAIYFMAGIACYAGAALTPRPQPPIPTALVRNLTRPLFLPFLWPGLETARQFGTTGQLVERGRFLLRFIPQWADGHILFASELALEASRKAPNTEQALDRLLAAMQFLEEAAAICPRKTDEIRIAMALLLELRADQDKELATALRLRTGMEVSELADVYLKLAEKAKPSASLHDRRAFLAKRLVGTALATGDVSRANEFISRALEMLATTQNTGLAAPHIAALERLQAYLGGDVSITKGDLLADPLLTGIAHFLPE
jgi:hypothetical protein